MREQVAERSGPIRRSCGRGMRHWRQGVETVLSLRWISTRGVDMKKATIAALSAAVLLFTSSMASAQFCVLGIFAAAAYVGQHENRELTSKEAMSCGLTYLFDKPEAEGEEEKKSPAATPNVTDRAPPHRLITRVSGPGSPPGGNALAYSRASGARFAARDWQGADAPRRRCHERLCQPQRVSLDRVVLRTRDERNAIKDESETNGGRLNRP